MLERVEKGYMGIAPFRIYGTLFERDTLSVNGYGNRDFCNAILNRLFTHPTKTSDVQTHPKTNTPNQDYL
jgi:hypothetical protein